MSIEERLDICEASLKGELTIEEARRRRQERRRDQATRMPDDLTGC
jgi:hypothetical protein